MVADTVVVGVISTMAAIDTPPGVPEGVRVGCPALGGATELVELGVAVVGAAATARSALGVEIGVGSGRSESTS